MNRDRTLAAYHEAGHACVAHHYSLPVHTVSLLGRGKAVASTELGLGPFEGSNHAMAWCLLAGSASERWAAKRLGWPDPTRAGGINDRLTFLEREREILARGNQPPLPTEDEALACVFSLWSKITNVAIALLESPTNELDREAFLRAYESTEPKTWDSYLWDLTVARMKAKRAARTRLAAIRAENLRIVCITLAEPLVSP